MLADDNILKFLTFVDISILCCVSKSYKVLLFSKQSFKKSLYYSEVPGKSRFNYWMHYSHTHL